MSTNNKTKVIAGMTLATMGMNTALTTVQTIKASAEGIQIPSMWVDTQGKMKFGNKTTAEFVLNKIIGLDGVLKQQVNGYTGPINVQIATTVLNAEVGTDGKVVLTGNKDEQIIALVKDLSTSKIDDKTEFNMLYFTNKQVDKKSIENEFEGLDTNTKDKTVDWTKGKTDVYRLQLENKQGKVALFKENTHIMLYITENNYNNVLNKELMTGATSLIKNKNDKYDGVDIVKFKDLKVDANNNRTATIINADVLDLKQVGNIGFTPNTVETNLDGFIVSGNQVIKGNTHTINLTPTDSINIDKVKVGKKEVPFVNNGNTLELKDIEITSGDIEIVGNTKDLIPTTDSNLGLNVITTSNTKDVKLEDKLNSVEVNLPKGTTEYTLQINGKTVSTQQVLLTQSSKHSIKLNSEIRSYGVTPGQSLEIKLMTNLGEQTTSYKVVETKEAAKTKEKSKEKDKTENKKEEVVKPKEEAPKEETKTPEVAEEQQVITPDFSIITDENQVDGVRKDKDTIYSREKLLVKVTAEPGSVTTVKATSSKGEKLEYSITEPMWEIPTEVYTLDSIVNTKGKEKVELTPEYKKIVYDAEKPVIKHDLAKKAKYEENGVYYFDKLDNVIIKGSDNFELNSLELTEGSKFKGKTTTNDIKNATLEVSKLKTGVINEIEVEAKDTITSQPVVEVIKVAIIDKKPEIAKINTQTQYLVDKGNVIVDGNTFNFNVEAKENLAGLSSYTLINSETNEMIETNTTGQFSINQLGKYSVTIEDNVGNITVKDLGELLGVRDANIVPKELKTKTDITVENIGDITKVIETTGATKEVSSKPIKLNINVGEALQEDIKSEVYVNNVKKEVKWVDGKGTITIKPEDADHKGHASVFVKHIATNGSSITSEMKHYYFNKDVAKPLAAGSYFDKYQVEGDKVVLEGKTDIIFKEGKTPSGNHRVGTSGYLIEDSKGKKVKVDKNQPITLKKSDEYTVKAVDYTGRESKPVKLAEILVKQDTNKQEVKNSKDRTFGIDITDPNNVKTKELVTNVKGYEEFVNNKEDLLNEDGSIKNLDLTDTSPFAVMSINRGLASYVLVKDTSVFEYIKINGVDIDLSEPGLHMIKDILDLTTTTKLGYEIKTKDGQTIQANGDFGYSSFIEVEPDNFSLISDKGIYTEKPVETTIYGMNFLGISTDEIEVIKDGKIVDTVKMKQTNDAGLMEGKLKLKESGSYSFNIIKNHEGQKIILGTVSLGELMQTKTLLPSDRLIIDEAPGKDEQRSLETLSVRQIKANNNVNTIKAKDIDGVRSIKTFMDGELVELEILEKPEKELTRDVDLVKLAKTYELDTSKDIEVVHEVTGETGESTKTKYTINLDAKDDVVDTETGINLVSVTGLNVLDATNASKLKPISANWGTRANMLFDLTTIKDGKEIKPTKFEVFKDDKPYKEYKEFDENNRLTVKLKENGVYKFRLTLEDGTKTEILGLSQLNSDTEYKNDRFMIDTSKAINKTSVVSAEIQTGAELLNLVVESTALASNDTLKVLNNKAYAIKTSQNGEEQSALSYREDKKVANKYLTDTLIYDTKPVTYTFEYTDLHGTPIKQSVTYKDGKIVDNTFENGTEQGTGDIDNSGTQVNGNVRVNWTDLGKGTYSKENNIKYYNGPRRATVTVDTKDKLKASQLDSNATVIQEFKKVDGKQQAVIEYNTNGLHQLDFDLGNNTSFKSEQFIIDTVAPDITISGVEENGLYTGDAIPNVTIDDDNFSHAEWSITGIDLPNAHWVDGGGSTTTTTSNSGGMISQVQMTNTTPVSMNTTPKTFNTIIAHADEQEQYKTVRLPGENEDYTGLGTLYPIEDDPFAGIEEGVDSNYEKENNSGGGDTTTDYGNGGNGNNNGGNTSTDNGNNGNTSIDNGTTTDTGTSSVNDDPNNNKPGTFSDRGTSTDQTFSLPDIPHEREYDGGYIATVTAYDKAGNSSTQSVRYGVRRFGTSFASTFVTSGNILADNNVGELSLKVKNLGSKKETELVQDKDFKIDSIDEVENGSYMINYTIESKQLDDGKYGGTFVDIKSGSNVGDINFVIDTKAPEIDRGDLKPKTTYKEKEKTFTIKLKDELTPDYMTLDVLVNDKPVEVKANDKLDTYTFKVDASNEKQTVTLIAKDTLGNTRKEVIKDITVGKKTPIVMVIALVAVLLGLLGVMFSRREPNSKSKDKLKGKQNQIPNQSPNQHSSE